FRSDNLFEILTDIYNHYASGVLKVSWGALQKRFLILNHNVVLFESSQHDENFWTALQQKELLKPEDLPRADQDLEEPLNHLLFLQAFSLEEFKSTYRELMKKSLMQVFQWPVSESEFFKARIENDPFCKIPVGDVLMEAARDYLPADLLKQLVPRTSF